MSAAEVIEQIKTLPLDEQKKVAEFVHTLDTPERAAGGVKRVDRPVFEKAMAAVFRKHDEVLRRLAE